MEKAQTPLAPDKTQYTHDQQLYNEFLLVKLHLSCHLTIKVYNLLSCILEKNLTRQQSPGLNSIQHIWDKGWVRAYH